MMPSVTGSLACAASARAWNTMLFIDLQKFLGNPGLDFYEARQDQVWLWSPWHRLEVFNSIRQLVRHPDTDRRLTFAEAKSLIHRLEMDVRLGYFTHVEADWRDVLRTANEISIE